MSFQSDFYSYLSGLGTPIGDRFYPLVLPEGEPLPACTLQRLSGPRELVQSGASKLVRPRYQLTVYDDDHAGAVAARDALVGAIEGFRGSMGPGNTYCGGIEVSSDLEDKEEDSGLFKFMIDALIWYREA